MVRSGRPLNLIIYILLAGKHSNSIMLPYVLRTTNLNVHSAVDWAHEVYHPERRRGGGFEFQIIIIYVYICAYHYGRGDIRLFQKGSSLPCRRAC